MPRKKRTLTEEQRERYRESTRRWRRANPDRVRELGRKWRDDNREKVRALTKAQTRRWYLKNKYGITLEAYDTMLAAQSHACRICGSPEPGGKRDWRIDHCHKTKRVRGLLCHNCNVAIGHVKDDIKVLKRMIRYLGGKL